MIRSFLKSVLSYILPGSDYDNEDNEHDSEEEEKEILNEINNFTNLDTDHLEIDYYKEVLGYGNRWTPEINNFGNLNTDHLGIEYYTGDSEFEDEWTCSPQTKDYVYKTGVITYLSASYGLIDNKFYFDVDCISPNLVLQENDKVAYITSDPAAYNSKVYKICSLSSVSHPLTHIKVVDCVVNGRITKLENRRFFVEPQNIWCNMNKVDTSFEPIEGDWVSLEAVVHVDTEIMSSNNEVIEVFSAKPSMMQNGPGRITFWAKEKNDGVINNTIVFDKTVCIDMYVPSLGDIVSYEAIESDQGKFKWRALWVKPDKLKPRKSREKELFKDKKGIVITQSLSVLDLKFGETKEIIVEVINKGEIARTLQKTRFYNADAEAECQLSLKSPDSAKNITLEPSKRLKFVVTCTGKNLGSTGELFEFHFDKFQIAKSFEINVLDDECVKELSCLNLNDCALDKRVVKNISDPARSNLVLHGKKPNPTDRFLRLPTNTNYEPPEFLWKIMLGPESIPRSTADALAALKASLPYLATDLSPATYVKRFRTLLYLEEIALKITFCSYDLSEATFEKKNMFWFVEVSGLAEGRPSILPGDKVLVTKSWSNDVTYVGYVHEVDCIGIHVDFNWMFRPKGEKFNVRFVPNTRTLFKCHEALNKAFKSLGKTCLFPSRVIEKPDRVSFEVADEPANKGVVNGTGERVGKKTLIWKNKNLNEIQKKAVVNVLRGVASPLPYILFGPPGTGKTTTLVEMIIQVSTLMPYSRVLICGPSNSCVDLLAERLIDSGIYKLGELTRLYAKSRVKNVPKKLLPYSACLGCTDEFCELSEAVKKTKVSKITLGTFCSVEGLNGLFSFDWFTHIFVDEAGQMTEPETLIPACFVSATKSQLVLAGDPKQLRAVCMSTVAAKLDFDRSLLERLISVYPYKENRKEFPETCGFDPRLVTKLTFNYRSLPGIIKLPNDLFYDSDIVPLISDEDSYEENFLKSINLRLPKLDKTPSIIFHGVVGKNLQESDSPSFYNPQELCQIVVYLKKIYESGVSADDVGIITPYSKQVQKCRNMLTSLNLAHPQIGSVNSFQGQEKHVIILSAVRSSIEMLKKDLVYSLGFVACPRRLNVALTRARTLLIILGNPNVLRVDPYWETVINYCVQNKCYVGCNIKDESKTERKNKQKEDSASDSD